MAKREGNNFKKNIIRTALFLFIILIFYKNRNIVKESIELFALWAYPNKPDRNGEVIGLIITILTAFAIAIGLYLTYIRSKATQRSVKNQDVTIANQNQQIELTRKSQINEQFKNAVEHLGSEKEPIILGGIAELHSIAKEEPIKYSEVVLNIFCSYIRSIAKIETNAKNINYTIVQTIINHIFKEKIYIEKEGDLRNCNLMSVRLENVIIKNFRLSLSLLPSNISNCLITDTELSGSKISSGTINNLIIKNCDLFRFTCTYTTFKNLEIYLDKNNNLNFFDCEFKGKKMHIDSYNGNYVACEFKDFIFESYYILNSNFYCSSFKNVKFNIKEITGCDFSACGFKNTSINSDLFKNSFSSIDSETEYFMTALKRRLSKRLNKTNDFSGLTLINRGILKQDEENLTEIKKNEIVEFYDNFYLKLNEARSIRKTNTEEKINSNL